MSKKRYKIAPLPVLEHDAAGIDVGASEVFVAVPADRDPEPVRSFETFTVDLERLADWLQRCRIRTVAMESTGVFWIPLYQILEKRGIQVLLVNAQHVKNVPGRKTDVQDCQWLQHLHAVGLLRGSFRPDDEICALRSLWRHRDNLIQLATIHLQHMQKSLDQMNLQIHHVISDLSGTTGLAIMDAILDGERDPRRLAQLRDWRIKANEETIVKSLVGDYREEHLYVLRQSLECYRKYQSMIQDLDLEVKHRMARLPSKVDPLQKPLGKERNPRKTPRRTEPVELRRELYRAFGVDLTQVPGINPLTAQVLLTEVGPNLGRFPTAAAFSSWLRLSPEPRISGGQVLSSRTRPTKNRAALALRLAAHALHKSQTFLGDYFRRLKARLGAPAAITAVAHKLARIVYHLITTQQEYDVTVFQDQERRISGPGTSHCRPQTKEIMRAGKRTRLSTGTRRICSLGEPDSASPAGFEYALLLFCRSSGFQPTANCVLTVCLSPAGKGIRELGPRSH
jgi:transposase